MQDYAKDAEAISLFCRINMNAKRELPIRASEMGMLILIVKSGISQTPIKIAEFFKVSKPMVTAMAASLLKKGYLLKTPSEEDKRSFTLSPTAKAIELVEQTYSEYYKTVEMLKVKMGEKEYDKLIELLVRANNILLEEKNG